MEMIKIAISMDAKTDRLVEDWRRLLNNRRTALLLAIIVGLHHHDELATDFDRADIVKRTVELPRPVLTQVDIEAVRLNTNRSVLISACVRLTEAIAKNGDTIPVAALLPLPAMELVDDSGEVIGHG